MLKIFSRNSELPTKYNVKITSTAQKDIENIWDYISQDNPMNAIEFIDEIEKRIFSLDIFPERNPVIPECQILNTQEYHHTIYKNYRIVYRFDSENVYVVRVVHGSKLLEIAARRIKPAITCRSSTDWLCASQVFFNSSEGPKYEREPKRKDFTAHYASGLTLSLVRQSFRGFCSYPISRKYFDCSILNTYIVCMWQFFKACNIADERTRI